MSCLSVVLRGRGSAGGEGRGQGQYAWEAHKKKMCAPPVDVHVVEGSAHEGTGNTARSMHEGCNRDVAPLMQHPFLMWDVERDWRGRGSPLVEVSLCGTTPAWSCPHHGTTP
jgi:hypothetical protein